jgi:hypothetical protein
MQVAVWAHTFLGLMAMYVSQFHLKKAKKLTAYELAEVDPKYKWVQRDFIPLYIGWMILLIAVFSLIGSRWEFGPYVVGSFFACIGLFSGAFAWKTGICVVPKRSLNTFFVIGDDAYRAGILQTVWSITVIVLAFVLTGRV